MLHCARHLGRSIEPDTKDIGRVHQQFRKIKDQEI